MHLSSTDWIVIALYFPVNLAIGLYRKVRPSDVGWRPIAALENVPSRQSLAWSAADWVAGCAMIYLALFGTGKIIFGNYSEGFLMLLAAGVCAWFIFWDLGRRGWETLSQ